MFKKINDYLIKILGIKRTATLYQFIKYGIVGGFATFVDWITFYLIFHYLGLYLIIKSSIPLGNSVDNYYVIGQFYLVSTIIGFIFGSITNYLLNKFITFKNKTERLSLQVGVFVLISVISLIITSGIMYVFVDIIGMQGEFKWGIALEDISRVLTTIIMYLINFVMHKYITFNKKVI